MKVFSLVVISHLGLAGGIAAHASECRVSFHLYDSNGHSLRGELVEMSYIKENGDRYLPKQDQRAPFRLEKQQIVFGREPNAGDRFWVRLKEPTGGYREDQFYFGYCGQRQSIISGSNEVAGGEGFTRVEGRLIGCRGYRDWWVKLVPMFGYQEQALNPEGDVDVRTGEFKVAGSIPGVRHVLIVGRGRAAVTVTAVDTSKSGTSVLKEMDMRDHCQESVR